MFSEPKNTENTKVTKVTKVIIGLSGGVDSSVAAYLLQQQGFQVEALFMKNWEDDDTDSYCSAAADLKDAQSVCDKLNIKLHTVNFAQEYWDKVFNYFLSEYKLARTPNPDILCNKEIKFTAFLDYAQNILKADYIATGHYAKIKKIDNKYCLLKAVDNNKDQSYFLHALNQTQLSKSLFPLGEINKTQIREIARSLGLVTHDKKDSTGICFIGEVKFTKFLSRYLPAQPGNILDQDNNIIGQHNGLMYYTIGQRQGLNLGGLKNYSELPWFVASKNLSDNTLTVVQGADHPLLYQQSAHIIDYHFIDADLYNQLVKNQSLAITVKTRYRQPDQAAELIIINNNLDKLLVNFNQPQRAITPGQSLVFYDSNNPNICLGGGIIY
ncbi:MAG: tRNA 2-thiouridine(34) synthase MnmA [Gammaproteobacteria bacterium]|nr:tRNA 2-thiouridine(34) synthase MnmA [Gammaproteobacteria bacterium]